MVAFVRGPETFFGPGQVYVKMLPDGEPVQLTNDSFAQNESGVFTGRRRGSRTRRLTRSFGWDTWIVPGAGGEPQRWLRNASGLVWSGPRAGAVFGDDKKIPHMGIVSGRGEPDRTARMSTARARTTAWRIGPIRHRMENRCCSWRWIEDQTGCRAGLFRWTAVRRAGRWGRQAAAARLPRGRPTANGCMSPRTPAECNHIWRQRFPDGKPEQITFGPTAEQGIAMAPDGRSFVTAVAMQDGRYGFTMRVASGRFPRWKASPITRSSPLTARSSSTQSSKKLRPLLPGGLVKSGSRTWNPDVPSRWLRAFRRSIMTFPLMVGRW